MTDEPTIFVVDDDPAARDSIAGLVKSKGVAYETYVSAEHFLENFDRSRHGCLVLDVRMDGMSGLELQQKLHRENVSLPIIIITGFGDVSSAVDAMRIGAVTFLEKPCSDYELWESIEAAIDQHRTCRQNELRLGDLQTRLTRLTPEEHQVMEKMIAGTPNKVIAAELEIGLRTVELRRANALKKMGARSVAELVRLHVEAEELAESFA